MSDSLNIDKVPGGAATPAAAAAPASAPVSAPAATETATLTLTPPAPVAEVAPPQAQEAVKLDPETVKKLDAMVAGYLDAIAKLDVHDATFAARAADIRKLGDDDIKASAQVSSRLLDRPVASLKHGGLSGSSEVSTSLLALRHQVDALDPAHQGDLLSPRKLFGILPFGDRLRNYFDKYQSSQSHINAIVNALYHGQDYLQKDNADIEQEKANLWAVMERLRQYIYLAQKLDAGLAARIAQIEATDPERAKILKEDMLFYVRQKVQDLTTQLAVSIQGYLALDVIRRNNLELIKGVDRATTTTVSALRTAVIVAQALGDQKLVLDQITALNTHHLQPDREHVRSAPPAVGRDQRAGGRLDRGHRQAPGGVRQHLRHDGRDRQLQAQGARQHVPDRGRAHDADRQGAGVPGSCAIPRRGRGRGLGRVGRRRRLRGRALGAAQVMRV